MDSEAGDLHDHPNGTFANAVGSLTTERTSRLEWLRIAHAQEAAGVPVLCGVPFDQTRLITLEH